MADEEATKIGLGPNDAALVLREDGSVEVLYPGGEDDDPVSSVAIDVACLIIALKDRALMLALQERLKPEGKHG